jgi:hypothetical protein
MYFHMLYSDAVSVAPGPEVVSGNLQFALQVVSGKFGIPYAKDGVCFGFAAMASLAFLDTSPDSWAGFLQRIISIKRLSSGVAFLPVSSEEQANKEFLLLLNIIQSPDKFSEYFRVRAFSSASQATILSDLPALVKLIMDCGERSCLPFSCIFQLLHSAVSACSVSGEAFLNKHSIDGIYSPSELKLYFESIQEAFTSGRLSINLSSMRHSVSVLYQAPDRFTYVDANQGVFPCAGLDDLVHNVLMGYASDSDTHYIFMKSTLMSVPELVQSNPFERLSSVDKWMRIHQKTSEKASLKGHFQWHGAQIAAANGYVEELLIFLQGFSPNHKFENDIALMDLATRYGHVSIVSALCKAGVLASFYDIECALLNRQEGVAVVLLGHLAEQNFRAMLTKLSKVTALADVSAKLFAEPDLVSVSFAAASIDEVMSRYQVQLSAVRAFFVDLMLPEREARAHDFQSFLPIIDCVFTKGAKEFLVSVDAIKARLAMLMTPTTFADLSLGLGGLYEALDSSASASVEAAYSV